jgi:DHA2 family multidrug resistance protein
MAPRGVATMATMVLVRHVIDRIDYRLPLSLGLAMTAVAFGLMSQMSAAHTPLWLAGASTLQGIGVGLLFTPLTAFAYSTLDGKLRADAAGVYSLVRQLGSASGLALMTAVLQARIAAHGGQPAAETLAATAATSAGYGDCFRVMAVVGLLGLPGVLLFRISRAPAPVEAAADPD